MGMTPEPGIYRDVPLEDYLQWPYASNSGISRLLRSAAHYKAYLAEPPGDTAALKVGRAIHTAILEPERFKETFVPEPEPDFVNYASPRSTKAYKEAVALLEATGRIVLKGDDLAAIDGVKAAAFAHPKLFKVIGATGEAELSIVWDDPETGVRCKARLDWHTKTKAGGAILDLKSTRDASPGDFSRSVYSYGYHRQGALYLRGAKEVGIAARHFMIAALEKTPPFGVVLYRLSDEAVHQGDNQVDFALARHAECERTGEWPGYTDDIVDIDLPPWAEGAIERDLEEQVI